MAVPSVSAEEAGFLAIEIFFHHHFGARAAEGSAEHIGKRGLGISEGIGNHHALARRQAIGLEHVRRSKAGERGAGFFERGRADIASGGDARAGAQILGEALRPFQLRGGLRRAEHWHPDSAQGIGQPIHQRRFRAYHHKADGLVGAERDYRGVVGHIQRDQLRLLGDTGISGGSVKLRKAGDWRQLPRQRMFAASRTQKQDIHGPSAEQ